MTQAEALAVPGAELTYNGSCVGRPLLSADGRTVGFEFIYHASGGCEHQDRHR
jgi:hypothetical protein